MASPRWDRTATVRCRVSAEVAGQEADLASAGDAAEIGDPGAGDTMEHGSGGE